MEFKVCVRCMTFNQASYIEDAMNGFCMQKTNFPFLCVVMDDCSTDGEQEVIKKYINDNFIEEWNDESDDCIRLMARHKDNKNCYFLVVYLKYNHYSIKKAKLPYFKEWNDSAKYLALCEGDDYWIDGTKLQKQLDFLDEHDDYSMCFHNAEVKMECADFRENELHIYDHLQEKEYSGKEILERWSVPTASVFYRNQSETMPWDKRFIYGDIVLYMWLASKGRLYCINSKMSVYRRNDGSVLSNLKGINGFDKRVKQFEAEEDVFSIEYKPLARKRRAGTCYKYLVLDEDKQKGQVWHVLKYVLRHPFILKYTLKRLKGDYRFVSFKILGDTFVYKLIKKIGI